MLHKIEIEGEDEIGTFYAKGYIVQKKAGTFLWFFKEYDDRGKAGQTGNLS